MREVFEICSVLRGTSSEVDAAPYFTDASILTRALGGVPTVILGPGAAHMAHQTDEWCECDRIEEAVAIYEHLIAAWCGLNPPSQAS
jgi:succinyl-diaminopimelate desuccinylase